MKSKPAGDWPTNGGVFAVWRIERTAPNQAGSATADCIGRKKPSRGGARVKEGSAAPGSASRNLETSFGFNRKTVSPSLCSSIVNGPPQCGSIKSNIQTKTTVEPQKLKLGGCHLRYSFCLLLFKQKTQKVCFLWLG